MNPKGEAIRRAMSGIGEVETIVRSLGRMPEGTAYHERVIEARKAWDRVETALKKLAQKTEHTCEVHGCYEIATRRHTIQKGPTVLFVKLCEVHSATSRHPEVKE